MESQTCNQQWLLRHLDDGLNPDEQAWMEDHLGGCAACREQIAQMQAFAGRFRDHVQQTTEKVDFTTFEKEVLNRALNPYRPGVRTKAWYKSFKVMVPVGAMAGLLLFFGYTRFMVPVAQPPSAIINSFTGSMSSVMIFETPETRQTILWYTEETDMESEHDAV